MKGIQWSFQQSFWRVRWQTSDGNVNLLNGETVVNRKGFNVYVETVAQQNQILRDLQDNLQTQARILQDLAFLDKLAYDSKLGQQQTMEILGSKYLGELLTLPYQLKQQQLGLQYSELATLIDVQSVLPDTMDEMYLDLTEGRYYYTDLVAERSMLLNNVASLENTITLAKGDIAQIAGDNDEFVQELDEVEATLSQRQTYQDNLDDLLAAVNAEIASRQNFIIPEVTGDGSEVTDIAALAQVDLGQLTDQQLGSLFLHLSQLDDNVAQDITGLQSDVVYLQDQIVLHQGDYLTYDLELQDVQADRTFRQEAIIAIENLLGMASYEEMDPAARALEAYSDLFSEDMRGTISGLLSMREYATVLSDFSQAVGDRTTVDTILGILQTLENIGYEGFDANLRALEPYVGVTLLSLGADALAADFEAVVNTITQRGPETYAELQEEFAYINEQIAQFETVLDIVTPMVDALNAGQFSYEYFDTELRVLAQYGEYVIGELWPHLEAITGFDTLPTINTGINEVTQAIDWRQQLDQGIIDLAQVQTRIAQLEQNIAAAQDELKLHPNLDTILSELKLVQEFIANVEADLFELDLQFIKVAWRYVDEQGMLDGAYGYLAGALEYTDNLLVERFGYKPDYTTPTPMSERYESIGLNTSTGDFYLPDKPVILVPWEYFEIINVPYGPGGWTLYELTPAIISKMEKEAELLDLRADLLESYGKGNKGLIGTAEQGDREQYGDLALAEYSMYRLGGSEPLSDLWPTTRSGLLKVIVAKERDLAAAEEEEAYWLGEQTIVQGLLNDIDTWSADLQNYQEEEGQLSILKSTLESNLKESGYDIYTLIQLEEMQTTLPLKIKRKY